jgi:predicted Zn-dependent protease
VTLHAAHAATPITATQRDQVIEKLPLITKNRAASQTTTLANPEAAAQAARELITAARQTGDTRYWGRAQAMLTPWWNKPDAPTDLMVLQATIQQGRHEFSEARSVLTRALKLNPAQAQGWLNLATLERLAGNYARALQACDAVGQAGQALYAQACQLETQSLQGKTNEARAGLQTLISAADNASTRSWLLSLLAESEERAGKDGAALKAYQSSLKQEADLYTSIALSDLLLRTGKHQDALKVLTGLPATDAVLLRQATAKKRAGDPTWTDLRQTLRERQAELKRRGDKLELHGREEALVALWLDEDFASAVTMAERNLDLQREPIDWWVAIQSARAASDLPALARLRGEMQRIGIVDARIQGEKS